MAFARTAPKACSHPWLLPVVVNDWHGALTQVGSLSTPPRLCRLRCSCFVKMSIALVHPLKPPQQNSKIRAWSPDILHWPDIIIACLAVNRSWTQPTSFSLPHVTKSPSKTTLDPSLRARFKSLIHRSVVLSGCFLADPSGNHTWYDFSTPAESHVQMKWSEQTASTKHCQVVPTWDIPTTKILWNRMIHFGEHPSPQVSEKIRHKSVSPTESSLHFKVQRFVSWLLAQLVQGSARFLASYLPLIHHSHVAAWAKWLTLTQ